MRQVLVRQEQVFLAPVFQVEQVLDSLRSLLKDIFQTRTQASPRRSRQVHGVDDERVREGLLARGFQR